MLQLTEKHRDYWRRTLTLTTWLLVIWFIVTFVMAYFATPLSRIVIAGFPLSFYMAAQGSLIIYVAMIWYYARKMGELDREYDVHEGDDE